MVITPAGKSETPRPKQLKRQMRFGIPFHSLRKVKLASSNPGLIISMREGHNILFENTLATDPNIVASCAVALDSRRSFKEFCHIFDGDLVPFVFDPRPRAFSLMRVNSGIGHTQMINTLLLARDRYLGMDNSSRMGYFLETKELLMVGRFSVDTARRAQIRDIHLMLWASNERQEQGQLEDSDEVRNAYLQFALALRDFGCPEDLYVFEHTAPAGELSKFANYLRNHDIMTLGDMIKVFGQKET